MTSTVFTPGTVITSPWLNDVNNLTYNKTFTDGTIALSVAPKNATYIRSLLWFTAAPTTGTWAQGDIVFKSNAAVGSPIGWVCTAAGTPGTWTAMANL